MLVTSSGNICESLSRGDLDLDMVVGYLRDNKREKVT